MFRTPHYSVNADGTGPTVTHAHLISSLLENAAGVTLDGRETTVTPALLTLNLWDNVTNVKQDGLETTVTAVPMDGLDQTVILVKDSDSARRVGAPNVSRMDIGPDSLIIVTQSMFT